MLTHQRRRPGLLTRRGSQRGTHARTHQATRTRSAAIKQRRKKKDIYHKSTRVNLDCSSVRFSSCLRAPYSVNSFASFAAFKRSLHSLVSLTWFVRPRRPLYSLPSLAITTRPLPSLRPLRPLDSLRSLCSPCSFVRSFASFVRSFASLVRSFASLVHSLQCSFAPCVRSFRSSFASSCHRSRRRFSSSFSSSFGHRPPHYSLRRFRHCSSQFATRRVPFAAHRLLFAVVVGGEKEIGETRRDVPQAVEFAVVAPRQKAIWPSPRRLPSLKKWGATDKKPRQNALVCISSSAIIALLSACRLVRREHDCRAAVPIRSRTAQAQNDEHTSLWRLNTRDAWTCRAWHRAFLPGVLRFGLREWRHRP